MKLKTIECMQTWTTGTGPDDPNDTGVHICRNDAGHDDRHECCCGASHE